ncbi:pseudouridine synthase [Shewanella waksmanii]|uniref:pseudouridine synthase n=1 Tax=Shewanella waksmanii TaxID=213783 RepID=UPI00373686C1
MSSHRSVRAQQASHIAIPENLPADQTVLAFLCQRFPHVAESQWRQRIIAGHVYWHDGLALSTDSVIRPRQRLYYFREVAKEQIVPLQHEIVYQDEQIIIAFKPPFLALHPSGQVVNECLVNRLRQQTGLATIVAAHRLDRATGGLVLLCKHAQHRDAYHQLFRDGNINKVYQAIAPVTEQLTEQLAQGELSLPIEWQVKNRIVKGSPSFTRQVVSGEANSHSLITLQQVKQGLGLFSLSPITGRTHQLRVHMASLGMPIVNDRCYPVLSPAHADDYQRPLQLLAQRLTFVDPVTQAKVDVHCEPLKL